MKQKYNQHQNNISQDFFKFSYSVFHYLAMFWKIESMLPLALPTTQGGRTEGHIQNIPHFSKRAISEFQKPLLSKRA